MEGLNTHSSVPRGETPEDASRREMMASFRTLSNEDHELLNTLFDPNLSEDEFRTNIAEFNSRNAGSPDSEESLAERESTQEFNVGGKRTLRIERSKRGTYQVSSPGLS